MKIFKITWVQFMTKEEPDFLMSFKYVFKSIKFPRQSFLFFKFGRVLVRNSGSLPTLPKWGYFPEELPILQLSSWKKQSGLVPLLPYELFLNSTEISLFPYTHIAEAGYLSLIFGSFTWTLAPLASLCSGCFLFYQRHFLSYMFMGPYRSLAVVEADSHGEIWLSYSSHSVTKRKLKKKKKALITETFSPVCLQHKGEAKSNLPHVTPSFHFH